MGVAFSPDGKTLAAGYSVTRAGGVVLWDVAARKRLVDQPLPVNEGNVQAWPSAQTARPSLPDTAAAVGGGGVVLWDVATRKRLVDEPLAVKEGCWRVAFSPDGKTLAAGIAAISGRCGAVGRGRTQTTGGRAAPRRGGQTLRAWSSARTARPSPPDTARRR